MEANDWINIGIIGLILVWLAIWGKKTLLYLFQSLWQPKLLPLDPERPPGKFDSGSNNALGRLNEWVRKLREHHHWERSEVMDKLEAKDWIPIGISGAALAWSIIWSIISYKLNERSNRATKRVAQNADDHAAQANALAEKANAIADQAGRRLSAESEITVLRAINEARRRVGELALKIAEVQEGKKKLTADEERFVLSLAKIYEEAVEALLNAYELACGMFLDKKIDEQRFFRQYHREIGKLYEFDDPYKKMLHPVNSDYNAIRKVRDVWHNTEK